QWPLGRKGDAVVVDGRTILPLDVWSAIESETETERALFQLIRPQRQMDELRLRVGYDPTVTVDPGALRDRLGARVQEAVGIEPQIDLVVESELMARSNGKVQRVVKV